MQVFVADKKFWALEKEFMLLKRKRRASALQIPLREIHQKPHALAFSVMAMFDSTYHCEQLFSKMKINNLHCSQVFQTITSSQF